MREHKSVIYCKQWFSHNSHSILCIYNKYTQTNELCLEFYSAVFSGKIKFDGKNYRTNSYNKILDIVYQETRQLQGYKKSEPLENSRNSDLVPPTGIEPVFKV